MSIQITQNAQRNWKSFASYKTELASFCNDYQARRKVFLDREQSNEKEGDKNIGSKETPGKKMEEKGANPNLSIIIELGIDNTSERELAWIERYSKWQAYVNKQFTNSFEQLIENDA
jgi:hypothetical protein